MWLPSTSSGSSSLDKSSLTLTCMELVYISLSNTNSQKEFFRINVGLYILYIGCEMQPCRRALPSAWDCLCQEWLGVFQMPHSVGQAKGNGCPHAVTPGLRAEGRAGYTSLVWVLVEELQLEGGSGGGRRVKAVGSPAPCSVPGSLAVLRARCFSIKALLLTQLRSHWAKGRGSPHAALPSSFTPGLQGTRSLPGEQVAASKALSGPGVKCAPRLWGPGSQPRRLLSVYIV